jgi:hypothetical protein
MANSVGFDIVPFHCPSRGSTCRLGGGTPPHISDIHCRKKKKESNRLGYGKEKQNEGIEISSRYFSSNGASKGAGGRCPSRAGVN